MQEPELGLVATQIESLVEVLDLAVADNLLQPNQVRQLQMYLPLYKLSNHCTKAEGLGDACTTAGPGTRGSGLRG